MLATLAILTLALLYWFPVRRWFARWGTTQAERARVMPGDPLVENPTHRATHAVTVDASSDDIWPWLVQMGYQRGGLYSYDWLDRLFRFLDRPSANRILPDFQQLAIGDDVMLGPGEQNRLTVAMLEPRRTLVLRNDSRSFQWIWQFGMYPIDADHTRLVSRGTEHVPTGIAMWLFMRVMEPAAFIMTRRMLLGLKTRAELLHAQRTARLDIGGQAA
jgi:hypothetical protein